jgi:hypothetical protein
MKLADRPQTLNALPRPPVFVPSLSLRRLEPSSCELLLPPYTQMHQMSTIIVGDLRIDKAEPVGSVAALEAPLPVAGGSGESVSQR